MFYNVKENFLLNKILKNLEGIKLKKKDDSPGISDAAVYSQTLCLFRLIAKIFVSTDVLFLFLGASPIIFTLLAATPQCPPILL